MSINTTKLLSGRSAVVDYGNLTADRYQFLSVGQAEPNLGAGADNSILTISTDNARVWTNSLTLSTITATGNISANYFFGNGSQLTGIITSVSNIVNGGSNLDIATANANVTISVSTVGNIAVFSPTGMNIRGVISANGNITGGNIVTTGLISANGKITSTANVTGGNLLTGGLISATSTITSSANISGGNVLTTGLFSSTGNATSGNVVTSGLVTATGNITGNYFIGNGSQLSGVTAESAYANALIGNTLSSNVTNSILTSVGILTELSVSGNASISNVTISDTTFSSTGNLIAVAGNSGIGIPAGNTSQRPVYPILGTTRFNTTLDTIETWDGVAWVTSGNVISPGVIVDQQISADGFVNAFSLVQSTTSEAILVSINGISQIPNMAYTVSGNVITFGQTPMNGDYIDIRFITYLTSVSSLTNYSGNSIVNITPSGNIQFTTANNIFATMTSNSFNISNPISTTGNITATNFIGNLIGNITGNIVVPGANTQVLYNFNGNIGAGSGFTFNQASNSLVITGNTTSGNLITTGRVSAIGEIISVANIAGGNLLTSGQLSATGNIIVGNIITSGTISATGNVTYGNIFTAGLISATGNATVGNISTSGLISAVGNAIVGNITTSGLITATGNVAAGNIVSASDITAVGNITGNYFVGNGSQLTGITTTYGNANVANYLPTFSGNLTADNISVIGNIVAYQFIGSGSTLNNIQGSNVSGNVASATIAYTAYSVSGANVSGNVASATIAYTAYSVSGANVTGNVANATYATTAGTARSVSGANVSGTVANATYAVTSGTSYSVSGSNVSGTVANATYAVTSGTASTVTSNAQANITSVGILNNLSVSGNINSGNLLTSGIISTIGNITAPYFIGNLIGNISGNLTVPGANTQVIYNNAGQANASSGFTFDFASNAMVVTGNITGGNLRTVGLVSATGNITGNFFNGNGSLLTGITAVSATTAATVTTNAQPNITSVGTLTSLTVTANVTGGNILTLGIVSATGNITASYFIGNVVGNISGNITVPGANTQVIYNNAGQANASSGFTFDSAANAIVVTGNVTGGNILTAGLISSTGNITGGNLSVGTGTITVGNIVNSNANAVGNIGSSSNYFNTVFAKATSALYADLAENYLADAEYAPGTVLSFGGEEELTISTQNNDPLVAGIVSTNPAYHMNFGLKGKFVVALALLGRAPCLVQGPVTAGAMMVSAGNGRARAEANPKMGTVIGKAVTGFTGNLGVIEILVGKL
jgi:hypothetical protein